MKAKHPAAILAFLFAIVFLSRASFGQYTIGAHSSPYAIKSPSASPSAIRGSRTVIHNPYGARSDQPYKYRWTRHNGRTDILVVPDYSNQIRVNNVKQLDHWDRARANYSRQMYGSGGVYSSYLGR